MLNKFTQKAAGSGAAGAAASQSVGLYDSTKIDGGNLPRAKQSAFRKRPVRLTYDKNEFWAYRLPSEQNFLTSAFSKQDVFGKNYGLEHSPHIAAQMNLDHKIFLGLIAGTILLAVGDQKRNGSFMTLRGNARQVQYGRFEADDFVKKN